jgi:hypothetical protein
MKGSACIFRAKIRLESETLPCVHWISGRFSADALTAFPPDFLSQDVCMENSLYLQSKVQDGLLMQDDVSLWS